MHASRNTLICNILCLFLIAQCALIRYLRDYHGLFDSVSSNALIGVLFTVAIFIWIGQVQKRLVQHEERKYLSMAGYLLIFLMLTRTIKFIFLPENHFLTRYAWYLYYIPQTLTVLFIFFAVLHIGKPYDEPISKKWKLLYIPAALIIIGVLTNDLHQCAFYFPNGLSDWEEYVHKPLYHISVIWLAAIIIAALIVVFIRASVIGVRKNIWLPLIPISFALVYLIVTLLLPDSLLSRIIKVAEMLCILFMSFAECMILSGLFPSNDSYDKLWKANDLSTGILDTHGNIRYRNKFSIPVPAEKIREAVDNSISLIDNNYLLCSHRITGGYVYWVKNVSAIRRVNDKLAELGDVLAEENSMLRAENELSEKRISIEQKTRLYNEISDKVSSELSVIDELLCKADAACDEEFAGIMKYAAVLTAFIKRYSNLILLGAQNDRLPVSELALALKESLEYLKLYGLKTRGEFSGDALADKKLILLAYRFFESVVEASIPGALAMIVSLEADDQLILRVEADSPREIQTGFADQIRSAGGTLECEISDGVEFFTLTLPLGGDR